ncbi:MAG TPA: FecR domain-containing protein [Kofleriaceae bacterium]|nr:FecR domain-containing protein [Kofleriaceae bacterium]
MSLKDRVQVEPLDDERWARIERGAVASVRPREARVRRSFAWAWGAGALAIAGVIGAVVLSGKSLRQAQEGKGTEPIVVATEAHGTKLAIDGATVEAAAETSFTVTRPNGAIDIELGRGRIELDVPHRADRAPLVVHAGDVDVIDVGTIFSVTRAEDVTVEVKEGEVQVARGGRIERVAAGQRWASPRIASATLAHAGSGSTTATTTTTSQTAIAIGTPKDQLARKHVATAPGGSGTNAVRSGSPPVRAERGTEGAESKDGASSGSDVIMDLAKAIKGEPVDPAVAVATPDFATYQAMMLHATGGTASQGLYGMARTKFAAGAAADAMQWLDAYLKRFPHGDEMEAVLWLRVRIRCQARIDDACRATAQTYLDRYPSGHRSHIAELVTNTR